MKIVREEVPPKWRIGSGVTNVIRDMSKIFVQELIETTAEAMQKRGEREVNGAAVREGYFRLSNKESSDFHL